MKKRRRRRRKKKGDIWMMVAWRFHKSMNVDRYKFLLRKKKEKKKWFHMSTTSFVLLEGSNWLTRSRLIGKKRKKKWSWIGKCVSYPIRFSFPLFFFFDHVLGVAKCDRFGQFFFFCQSWNSQVVEWINSIPNAQSFHFSSHGDRLIFQRLSSYRTFFFCYMIPFL